MRCKCGKEIWGEGWNPKTGQRFYSHVEGGEEQHEDGTWVEPAAPTAPHYESKSAAKEDAEAFNAPVGQPAETQQIAYSSSMPHVNCTGPCCRPDLWASGVKGVAVPTAPVGQPEPKPRRFSSLAKKANAPVSQFEKEFLEPAAPAANALPEMDKQLYVAASDVPVGTGEAVARWDGDGLPPWHPHEIERRLKDQLAAAQQEIETMVNLKVFLTNRLAERDAELAALRQSHAEELKQARRDAIEEARLAYTAHYREHDDRSGAGDACKQCGDDFRDRVHLRVGETRDTRIRALMEKP